MTLAAIPSPTTAVWYLGPLPIRAYALFIILGIIVACVVTEARLRARGAPRLAVLDVAVWAVPFGIIGGRLYHVITTPERFFGEDGNLVEALYVWQGGLGIWGAIAGGAVGVWLACRQLQIPFRMVADAAAVGIPLAQAIGRLGNWFNNELYGSETSLPWGLEVHQMSDFRAETGPAGNPIVLEGLYHPTFLYEALWNVAVAIVVWQLGKRLRLGQGRQFALYVMGYTAGRFWIEMLRIDDTAADPQPGSEDTVITILGQRLNVWVAAAVFVAALVYFLRKRGQQEFLLPPEEEGGRLRVVTEQEFREYHASSPDTPASAVPESEPDATPDRDADSDQQAAARDRDAAPDEQAAASVAGEENANAGSSRNDEA